MFERTSQTWEIMTCCMRVLRKDKELMIFPIISGVTMLLMMACFFYVLIFTGSLLSSNSKEATINVLVYAYLFLFYLGATFIIVFFNTAIVACAIERLQGGDPTVGYGLREAGKRLHLILGWSLLSGTVGLVLHLIEERLEFLGRVISAVLGAIWGLVTFFAIPVLVAQNLGPIDTLKESGRLFRERWGEQIIGNFSFGLLGFLLSLPFFALMGFGIVFGGPMMFVLLGIGALGVVGIALIQGVLSSIFQAALYLYARDGMIGEGFREEELLLAVKTFE
ncbi:DUF6159 family protein [Myxococcota bacterium]|nr:DUF6159 family protein [Myxococcota bacterium]